MRLLHNQNNLTYLNNEGISSGVYRRSNLEQLQVSKY